MSLGEYLGAGSTTKLLLHLNGNSNDSSGNGNNGIDTNITYGKQYGKFNEGAYFNGSNSDITLPVSIDVNGFTIIAWRYIINSNAYRNIISKCNGNQPQPFDIYVIQGTNTCSVWVGDGTGTTALKNLQIPNSVVFNKWQCWMVTVDSSKNVLAYVDGRYLGMITAQVPIADGSNPVRLGIRQDGFVKAFGYADDTIIENRVWTLQEYQKYYTNSLGRF